MLRKLTPPSDSIVVPAMPVEARRVELVSWDQLNHQDRARLTAMRGSDSGKSSPFFSNEFFDAVQKARGDVRVAVIEDEQNVIGYLPFHHVRRAAKPVGRFLNDAHNLIAWPSIQIDWRWLLRECRVNSFDFHALAGSYEHLDAAAYLEPKLGFEALLEDDSAAFLKQLESEHRTIRKQEQKTRKMVRECGPLRFEMDCEDLDVLEAGMRWKREQYRRTNILDLFLPNWTRQMIRLLHQSEAECRVMVSAMWSGEILMAVHIGMLENDRLHYWFPAYNATHSIYSPGTALFKQIVAGASDAGIRMIDMGYGEQPYKRKQTDHVSSYMSGHVTTQAWIGWQRHAHRRIFDVAKRSPMKATLKRWLRRVKPDAGMGRLD